MKYIAPSSITLTSQIATNKFWESRNDYVKAVKSEYGGAIGPYFFLKLYPQVIFLIKDVQFLDNFDQTNDIPFKFPQKTLPNSVRNSFLYFIRSPQLIRLSELSGNAD